MARRIDRLTARTIAVARRAGYYRDGRGLALQVSDAGTKSWLFLYTLNGKAREMGLGPVADVGLAEAREKATAARALLREGIDPIEQKRAQRAAQRAQAATSKTFGECATAYIKAHRASWHNEKHAEQWTNTLATYANPVIGALPVAAIDTALVLRVLEPIWTTKYETASRLRGRIERVLGWARVQGLREGENPARLRDHLDHMLPKRPADAAVEHHEAMEYRKVPAFLKALRKVDSVTSRALEFAVLTATRTSEVIGARREEFDLAAGIWTLPPLRMKAKREHRVPLSPRAVAIVREQLKGKGAHVFPLSNMAMLMLLKRMGLDVTVHGFRSSFRDWCAEQTNTPNIVAEMALGHAVSDKVEAAYRRGDLLDKRAALMRAWAAFCAGR